MNMNKGIKDRIEHEYIMCRTCNFMYRVLVRTADEDRESHREITFNIIDLFGWSLRSSLLDREKHLPFHVFPQTGTHLPLLLHWSP